MADGGILRILHSNPGAVPQPKTHDAPHDRLRLPQVFPSGARLLGAKTPASQRGAEINQVVLDVTGAIFSSKHVERVDGSRIIVIQPSRKHSQTSKFTTVLMGKDVIWIVRPRAEILEGADWLSFKDLAREGPISSIAILVNELEDLLQNGVVHSAELLSFEENDVVLRHVESDCIKEFRGDHLGSRCHFRVVRRIELDEINVAAAVANSKTRRNAFRLRFQDPP